MTSSAPARRGQVVAPVMALGLAGVFAVLFTLGNTYGLFDWTRVDPWAPLDGVLLSSNVAVTVLLTVAGHVFVHQMLEARNSGTREMVLVLARYLVGLATLLVLVVAAVYAVHLWDGTDPVGIGTTRESAQQVLLLRWNEYVAARPFEARADLAPLWYFSVEAQLVAVAFFAVLWGGRSPALLCLGATAAAVGAYAYSLELLGEVGWFGTTLSTVARADGFLLGMAAACLPRVRRLSPHVASATSGSAVLVLLAAVLASSWVDPEEFVRVQGPVVAVATALFLAGAAQRPDERASVVALFSGPAASALGTHGRALVAWSLPVFVLVARHAEESTAPVRALLALVVLVVVVVVTELGRSALVSRVRWPGADRRHEQQDGSARVEVGDHDRGPRGEPPAEA